MKKIIILLIVLIALLYVSTGRYATTRANIQRDGWDALIDEPFWIMGWVGDHLGEAKQKIDDGIDGKRFQEEEYGKVAEKVSHAE
jgi:hypothetical protein